MSDVTIHQQIPPDCSLRKSHLQMDVRSENIQIQLPEGDLLVVDCDDAPPNDGRHMRLSAPRARVADELKRVGYSIRGDGEPRSDSVLFPWMVGGARKQAPEKR